MAHLLRAQRPGHVHVGLVAEDVLGLVQRAAHRRDHQLGGAGTEADHAEPAARLAQARHLDGLRGAADQQAVRLEHLLQRQLTAQPVVGALARRPRGEAQRHAEAARRLGQRAVGQRRTGGQQAGQRRRGQSPLAQGAQHAPGKVVIAAIDRDDQGARVDQQLLVASGRRAADADAPRGIRAQRQARLLQPGRGAVHLHGLPGQQVGNEALALVDVGQHVAVRRIEQAGAEAQLARSGDRRGYLEDRCHFAGEMVDAAQPAEQRHHRAAVLGHRQHRRLLLLVGQHGGQAADHDAGRAQGDDRRVAAVQRAQGGAEIVVGDVGGHPALQAVDRRLRVAALDAPRRRQAGGAENHDCRNVAHQPRHLWPGIRISEKYGEAIGSTWSSGTMRCCSMLALSI